MSNDLVVLSLTGTLGDLKRLPLKSVTGHGDELGISLPVSMLAIESGTLLKASHCRCKKKDIADVINLDIKQLANTMTGWSSSRHRCTKIVYRKLN